MPNSLPIPKPIRNNARNRTKHKAGCGESTQKEGSQHLQVCLGYIHAVAKHEGENRHEDRVDEYVGEDAEADDGDDEDGV